MKKKYEEKELVEEIVKGCSLNFFERIVVRRYRKIYVKIYRKGLQDGFNWCNKMNLIGAIRTIDNL